MKRDSGAIYVMHFGGKMHENSKIRCSCLNIEGLYVALLCPPSSSKSDWLIAKIATFHLSDPGAIPGEGILFNN